MPYNREKFDEAIWDIVRSIPQGKVMSYGNVARAAGYPRYSRMVSKAMTSSAGGLPWYRVVRSNLTIAFPEGSQSYKKQVRLLKTEGVSVSAGKVSAPEHSVADDLDRLLWGPDE